MTTLPPAKPRLLIVDDERYICEIVVESLGADKYAVQSFTDPREAVEYLKNNPIDLVLTDLVMGDFSGVDILETALATQEDAVIILMTAYPTVQLAISVLKKGAYDLLVKPFKLEVVKAAVRRGLEHQRIVRENLNLRGQVGFLKAASGQSVGADYEAYLATVLASCTTELCAVASALIEIDPKTRAAVRKISQPADSEFREIVLDDATLEIFNGRKMMEPAVTTEDVVVDGRALVKTLISSPIYVRRQLHGVINLLILDRFQRLYRGQMDVLTILTSTAGSAIANRKLYQDVKASYLQAIRALANAVEARDQYTAGHTDRVIKLAEHMAQRLGWSKRQIDTLAVGCTLHDIGKIGVPDSVLNKPDQLTDEERQIIMRHPLVGIKIIGEIDLFKPAVPYIISHHERYDGTGYPKGLRGEDIPVEGRLLAVVDTFDAIISDRPYRKGAPLAIAMRELVGNKGKQFDPVMVDLFIDILRKGEIKFSELYGRELDVTCLESFPASETVSV